MLIWFAIGTALILLELVTPTFILMFFGLGAWGAALTAHLYPGIPQESATFIIITAISLILLRKKMKEVFQGIRETNNQKNSTQNFSYIGQQALVNKEISPHKEGEVSIGGSYWRAKSDVVIEKDSMVIIEKQDEDDKLLLIVSGPLKTN